MERYYIYIDWKDGETTEGFYAARTKEEALKQALFGCENREDIFDVCVFKEMRNIKF